MLHRTLGHEQSFRRCLDLPKSGRSLQQPVEQLGQNPHRQMGIRGQEYGFTAKKPIPVRAGVTESLSAFGLSSVTSECTGTLTVIAVF